MAKSKKYTDATRRYDREQLHAPDEALGVVKTLASRNFDETVEVAYRLGVDPRKADQMLRGTVSLPSGTGKDVRVAVFATGDAARRQRRREPTSSGPTTSWPRSRTASSTSTSPSRRPTSWARSDGSAGCSARVA